MTYGLQFRINVPRLKVYQRQMDKELVGRRSHDGGTLCEISTGCVNTRSVTIDWALQKRERERERKGGGRKNNAVTLIT